MGKGQIIVLNSMIMNAVQSDVATEAERAIEEACTQLENIGEEELSDLLFNIWSGVLAHTPVYNRMNVAIAILKNFEDHINRERK